MRSSLLVLLALVLPLTACAFDDEPSIDAAPPYDCVHDSSPDATDPCAACGPNTMCVQLLGGTCGSLSVTCKPIVPGCEQPVCSGACDQAYCDPGHISTCYASPCAENLPGAFHCYGV